MVAEPDSPSVDPARSRWRDYWVLALVCVLFLGFRVPLMYRQPGGMDEADFAVPGYTILRDGIPRIPYNPGRNPDGFFYRADEALFLLPPLYFYWQAAFYAVLPPGYGTARLASGIAAVLAIVLTYLLGLRLTGDRASALCGAGLYSISRVCFFPAMSARPDMLCGMLGLAAVAAFLRWRDAGRLAWLLAAAALLGLGGLTHPFALVYAVQIGVWTLLGPGPLLRRLRNVGILATGAVLVFSLWLILIIPRYEIFRIQFFTNVLSRSGPGLLERFVWPWESIAWHAGLILEHAGPLQVLLMFGGLVAATAFSRTQKNPGMFALLALAWSSVYLLVVCEGLHHTKGYWCYPGAWLFLCVGWCVLGIFRWGARFCRQQNIRTWACRGAGCLGGVGLLLLMLPGSGFRALAAHINHWNDLPYDAPRFTQMLLDQIPRDARVVVDTAYALPFYLDGRAVILAGACDLRAPDDYQPYDFYIAGTESLDKGCPETLGARLVKQYGEPHDVFACYAQIYRPGRFPENSRREVPEGAAPAPAESPLRPLPSLPSRRQ